MARFDALGDFRAFLSGDLREHAREVRRTWHCNLEWIMANGASAPGIAHLVNFDTPHFRKNGTVGDRDILREYLPHAREFAIRVVAYVNLHWMGDDFCDAHPGWEQLLADGRAYGRVHPLYGGGTTCCVNAPWRDWAFLMLREVMKTGVDGAFLDGPVVFPGACYCPVCSGLFQRESGSPPPRKEDWGDPLWIRWLRFREESMKRFVADATAVVKEARKDAILFCNAGGWSLNTSVARHPWLLEGSQDFTGAEEFVHPGAAHEDYLDTAVMAKFLSAGANPSVVFTHHSLGAWHYVGLNPADLARCYSQTVANGANPWSAVFLPALEHQKGKTAQPVKESWGFLERHEDLYGGDACAARVAVLRSDSTAVRWISGTSGFSVTASAAAEKDLVASVDSRRLADLAALKGHCERSEREEFRGWCYALIRGHVPFRVLRERDLEAGATAGLDLIVCPNAACLSDRALGALSSFLEAGGSVVSTFETGWYTEEGKPREAARGGIGVPRPAVLESYPSATFEEYALMEKAGADLGGFDAGELVPRTEYALKLDAPPGSLPLAFYMNPIGRNYAPPRGVSPHPMILSGSLGKGSWAYFSCLPGAGWRRFKVPQWEDLMTGSVRMLLGGRLQVRAGAPKSLEVELRAKGDRLCVHLVNNAGDNVFPLTEGLSAGRVRLSVACRKPVRVWSTAHRSLPFTYRDGRAEFSLTVNHVYEIVVLEEGA